eukprot:TRINITY_DN30507_c0_g1_i2.p3 TRINITY_DN30507_c0_g1~~TRINITY_DN30507_c0_g1_i2.p3  ORF type:complete len:152 (+),score=44.33 TRINITY_DN30507_c0_g1_i2:385-840(+)
MPLEGKPKGDGPRVGERLRSAGQAVGIDFTGKTDRYPNTLLAHTLLEYALKHAGPVVQDQLQEILFRHYFTDGLYPDSANLRRAAEEVGLDPEDALRFAQDHGEQGKVREEALGFSDSGVSGVPFFFVNGQPEFSGAQPPSAFTAAFAKAK